MLLGRVRPDVVIPDELAGAAEPEAAATTPSTDCEGLTAANVGTANAPKRGKREASIVERVSALVDN